MFLNEICKSDRLKSTELLIIRLKETHKLRPNVMEDLRKLLAGFRGEKEMKYYLQFLPEKDCLIIHNLRLYDGKTYFQIDYLILTQRFALILECKNYYGEVHFDSNFNQLIRKVDEKEEGFSDPISQAKRHQRQLQTYFKLHNLPPIPIEFLVIFSNPSTIIKGNPAIKDKVIHSHSFLEKWEKMHLKYKVIVMDRKMLRKVSKNFMKNNTTETVDLLKKYGLHPSDLITGVQCPACEKFAMQRKKRKWFCPHCNSYDTAAHQKAVIDYLLLIKPTITNKEFREFAHITSRETAAKMLVRMKLPSTGENKGRKYHKP
ncbi:TPA: NERD domain-containing protein [Yersinia enterocolitica]|nr:NERD domain-containing protein [Yersinia enterocolitica]